MPNRVYPTRSVGGTTAAAYATATPNQGSGQKTVTTSGGSTIAIPAYNRVCLWLTNTGASGVSVGLGAAAVAKQGIYLPANSNPICIQNFSGDIYLVSDSGSPVVAYAEY